MTPTEKKYKEALENIALYVLPVYTKDGEKYVKVEHALQLREFAKEALGK